MFQDFFVRLMILKTKKKRNFAPILPMHTWIVTSTKEWPVMLQWPKLLEHAPCILDMTVWWLITFFATPGQLFWNITWFVLSGFFYRTVRAWKASLYVYKAKFKRRINLVRDKSLIRSRYIIEFVQTSNCGHRKLGTVNQPLYKSFQDSANQPF